MNKMVFVGIGIVIVLLIVGASSIMSTDNLPNQETEPVEQLPTEILTEGKDLSINFSDGISAQSP